MLHIIINKSFALRSIWVDMRAAAINKEAVSSRGPGDAASSNGAAAFARRLQAKHISPKSEEENENATSSRSTVDLSGARKGSVTADAHERDRKSLAQRRDENDSHRRIGSDT